MRARDDPRHRHRLIHVYYIPQQSQCHQSFYRQLHHALQYILLLLQTRIVDCMEPPYPEPQFLPRLLNVTAREGSKVVLPCAVLYLGTKQVTWRRLDENHFLSIGDLNWIKDPNLEIKFHEQTPEVTEWNLVIKKVSSHHSGTYECQISDKVKLTRYIHLHVIGPPVVESASFPPIALSGKNYVERGQAIHLYCNISGSDGSHLSIDWFKDGDKIDHTNYKHVVITSYNMVEPNVDVSELLIDRSNPSDTGTYICRSANGYIDSTRVTVLFADSSNVKRGNPSSVSAVLRPECLLVATVMVATIVHVSLELTSASHWQYCQ